VCQGCNDCQSCNTTCEGGQSCVTCFSECYSYFAACSNAP
jgi:hypothetical protein